MPALPGSTISDNGRAALESRICEQARLLCCSSFPSSHPPGTMIQLRTGGKITASSRSTSSSLMRRGSLTAAGRLLCATNPSALPGGHSRGPRGRFLRSVHLGSGQHHGAAGAGCCCGESRLGRRHRIAELFGVGRHKRDAACSFRPTEDLDHRGIRYHNLVQPAHQERSPVDGGNAESLHTRHRALRPVRQNLHCRARRPIAGSRTGTRAGRSSTNRQGKPDTRISSAPCTHRSSAW